MALFLFVSTTDAKKPQYLSSQTLAANGGNGVIMIAFEMWAQVAELLF